MSNLFYFSIIVAFLALIFAGILAWRVKRIKTPSHKADEIAKAIQEGAMAFLKKEYRVLIVFVLAVEALLVFVPGLGGYKTALAFLLGALLSLFAGNIGMRIATIANLKTAFEAKISLNRGLKTAFSSGSVMGLSVVGLGVLGIALLYWLFRDPQIIYGFGFGASSVALFSRVGGGIYTKAADVGADLVGKVEKNIPEDDPRNPAVIADNVGDNVGDVAGMGADLFESYVEAIIAAMVLGGVLAGGYLAGTVILPLILAGAGTLASLLGILVIRISKKGKPNAVLNRGVFSAAFLTIIFSFIIIYRFFQNLNLFWAILAGLIAGIIIGLATEYFTSHSFDPTKKLAKSSEAGSGPNIIQGLSLGMGSTLFPILAVSAAIFIAYRFAGLYGIAISAVGMLSTLGITLATDCYGPVADNAAGIAEMAGLGQETRRRTEALDAVGNTTAAVGKGFAIGSAALTALVLAVSFSEVAGLRVVDLTQPKVLIGLFVGGMLSFLFSSLTMGAVGRAASGMVNEVRRQFREIKGLMAGKAKPDYSHCVEISTEAALKEMIGPSLLAVISPVVIGFLLGPESLVGLLLGATGTGFLLAITMANSGGAWDNAKKYIEAGNFGGKGSFAHKAAVVGDTVGDPCKDTAGPALNILIKLMSIVALIIVSLL